MKIVYSLLGIFIIGLVILIMYIFNCCMFDFTDEGKAMSASLEKEYTSFFKEQKRTPTTQESFVMLTKAGCQKLTHLTKQVHNGMHHINLRNQNFICEYDGVDLYIYYGFSGNHMGSVGGGASKVTISDLRSAIGINALSTECRFGFSSEGNPKKYRKNTCQTWLNFPFPGSR